MKNNNVYLDTYIVQKDMRIRLPKEILRILNLSKGVSLLDIYVDKTNGQILLKPTSNTNEVKNEK